MAEQQESSHPAPERRQTAESISSQRSERSREVFDSLVTSTNKHIGNINSVRDANSTELTALRAHYLKKELVSLQFGRELRLLCIPDALSCLGHPFSGPAPESAERLKEVDLPFLHFAFKRFFLTFPFLRNAKVDFWQKKVQTVVNSFVSKGISTSEERDEESHRKKMAFKLEKHLGLLLSNGLKLASPPGEEVVRVQPADLDRLEPATAAPVKVPDLFEINVLAVRSVKKKGRLRDKSHEEFIICTRNEAGISTYVARRYGAFRALVEQLKLDYPEEEIRALPQKNKAVSGSISQDAVEDGDNSERNTKGSGTSSPKESSELLPLAREKNRLTLRSYLRALLRSRVIANSLVLRDFLLNDPIEMSASEIADAERRGAMDRLREQEQARFKEEANRQVGELDEYLGEFKKELMGTSGFTKVSRILQQTPLAKDLPTRYQKVLEWGRISLASTIYQLFLGSDDSSEVFAQLKRVHGMIPYFMLRQILRISNPVGMIRGVIDLFLAQPFGQRSLLQRIFSGSLQEDLKDIARDIDAVCFKIDSPTICAKLKMGVNTSLEQHQRYKDVAVSTNTHILTAILLSDEGPLLDEKDKLRVQKASSAHQDSVASARIGGEPDNIHEWFYEDLHVLHGLLVRQRDKLQLNSLIFEGHTAELLRDIVAIFYEPLARVYKAANITDSLSDLQKFIDDLIKTVEKAERAMSSDPQLTVQAFMDLTSRHEQAFYHFAHKVHAKGFGLFDDLMHWIEQFVAFLRDGFAQDVDLEFLLPQNDEEERGKIFAEVDELIYHHYRLKLAHEERLRRRMLSDHAVKEDAAVNDLLENLQISSLKDDFDGVEDDEDMDSEDEGVQSPSADTDNARTKDPMLEPTLHHLPALRSLFVEVVRPLLEHALMEVEE